jgi:hypothetical protein
MFSTHFALYFELFRFSFYLLSFSERAEASGFLYIHLLWSRITSAARQITFNYKNVYRMSDRLCGLVVRVIGYRSGGPGSIPSGTTRKKKVVGLERGPLSLVSTTEELLDRKVAAPV